jgi:2-hydroxychromene-2-carboxylate isomerase
VAKQPILYFDLGSPYAYLAFARAPAVLGAEPELCPILLGAVFARRGFGSWSATEARAGRIAEIEARAQRYGLPALRWPPGWPADGLAAMRAAVWSQREGRLGEFTRAVFAAQFAEGGDIADLALLEDCARAAGLPGGELADAISRAEIKQELRDRTDAAWDAGVRGVPSIAVGSSLFFGDEQMELAAALIAA